MTNVEKAQEIASRRECDGLACWQCKQYVALEMAQWKDKQLDDAIEKATEHQAKFLKEGKITQYGMDNVFAFIHNLRHFLNNSKND